MALVLTCDLADLTIDNQNSPQCTNWVMTEYTDASNLIATMDGLLGFDAEVFGIVEGFFLITFLTALFAGKAVRVLMRA